VVHPVERLRHIARATGAPQGLVATEAAWALAAFAHDPQGLVTACRRMVSRQPGNAALVWLCARALTAGDPASELRRAVADLEGDRTPKELEHAIPSDATVAVVGWPETIGEVLPRRGDVEVLVVDVRAEGSGLVRRLAGADVDAVDVPASGLAAAVAAADLVLLEAEAVAPAELLAAAGSHAAAAVAHTSAVPVWVVAGVGRLLPGRMWEPLRSRVVSAEPWDDDDEVVPLRLIDSIVGPSGPEPVDAALRRTDCPVAPELFKGDVI
jgi:hypothetical protein